jgi:hypothetical protein
MRRKPISQSRRLEDGQLMGKNLVGRATGIDLDHDGEQAGHHVRFARRAEKKPPVAADAGEPSVPVTITDAVAIDSEAHWHRREAPAKLDKSLVALAPAWDDLEFFDDAALGLADVTIAAR